MQKVKIPKNPNECWEWTAHRRSTGYGGFDVNGKTLLAHRVAYEHFYGEQLENLKCLHKCDNTLCVNPAHLWKGTQKDNVYDMVNKKRNKTKWDYASTCSKGHERKGPGKCKECLRIWRQTPEQKLKKKIYDAQKYLRLKNGNTKN